MCSRIGRAGSSGLFREAVTAAAGILGQRLVTIVERIVQTSDLDFSGMRQSFGGGVAIYLGKDVIFPMAVALGGGEGSHPYFVIPRFL